MQGTKFMDTVHWNLLQGIVVCGSPAIFAVVAVALAWRTISHRALFAAIAFFSLWGIGAITYPIAYDLVDPPVLSSMTYPGALFNVLAITAVAVAIVGFPILWGLRNALRTR
jgi:hypothetical protein